MRALKASLLLVAASAILAITPAAAGAPRAACEFKSEPIVLISEGDPHVVGSRLLQVWDEPDQPSFWSNGDPTGDEYSRYTRKLTEQNVHTDPVMLLKASPSFNNDVVARNASRWIKPATCLEKLLIGRQNERIDLLENTTEFVAVVLRWPSTDRVRVYFYTVNRNGIGRMSPVTSLIDIDAAAGGSVDLGHSQSLFLPTRPHAQRAARPQSARCSLPTKLRQITSAARSPDHKWDPHGEDAGQHIPSIRWS